MQWLELLGPIIRLVFSSPTDDPFVQLTAKGCERLLGKPLQKSEPLTSPIVKALVDTYRGDACLQNIPKYRFLLLTLLCYAGFLRIDELLHTQLQHVYIDEDRLSITLPKSKCDQLREGNVVHIARIHSKYCPVTFVEEFMALTGLTFAAEQAYLLPRIIKIKQGYKVHRTLGISYTTARELFKQHVQAVFGSDLRYTLHGLRAGGASDAANNGRSPNMAAGRLRSPAMGTFMTP